MSRIPAVFDALKQSGRTALIPYVTAGDPGVEATVPVLLAMAAQGADILELGIPFSDPMADGPVIQKACERALERGVDLSQVLAMVHEFRNQNQDTPIVLMGYMNPIERYGAQRLAKDAQAAGVDALLIVDLPPEEAGVLRQELAAAELDEIFLVAPTTTDARCAVIAEKASGFIYYVALKGVTGAGHADYSGLAEPINQLRRHTDLPIGVGFGIRDAASACEVAAVADAVVIGTSLVDQLSQAADTANAVDIAAQFIAPIRAALDEQSQPKSAASG